ncbi:MAG: DUF4249 domain-containing protein [Flavobacteriales bacterium]|nr:DUF4249 domain-containing protein [Flavobacteriales bacterium]
MKNYYYLLIISVSFSISACKKEIPFDDDVTTDKLVVNSIHSPDNNWQVQVTHSVGQLESIRSNTVENAQVFITDLEGNLIDSLVFNTVNANSVFDFDGDYIGTMNPIIGNYYRIEVSAEGYETVSAVNNIPSSVEISLLDTGQTIINGDKHLQLTISFEDPASEINYYYLTVTEISPRSTYNGFVNDGWCPECDSALVESSMYFKVEDVNNSDEGYY